MPHELSGGRLGVVVQEVNTSGEGRSGGALGLGGVVVVSAPVARGGVLLRVPSSCGACMRAMGAVNCAPPWCARAMVVPYLSPRKTYVGMPHELSGGRLQVVVQEVNTSARGRRGRALWLGSVCGGIRSRRGANAVARPLILLGVHEGDRGGELLCPLVRSGGGGALPIPPENLCRYAP